MSENPKILNWTGRKIDWLELERLAYSPHTPKHLAKDYQNRISFLSKYIPDRDYRIKNLGKGQLILDKDGYCKYQD